MLVFSVSHVAIAMLTPRPHRPPVLTFDIKPNRTYVDGLWPGRPPPPNASLSYIELACTVRFIVYNMVHRRKHTIKLLRSIDYILNSEMPIFSVSWSGSHRWVILRYSRINNQESYVAAKFSNIIECFL